MNKSDVEAIAHMLMVLTGRGTTSYKKEPDVVSNGVEVVLRKFGVNND